MSEQVSLDEIVETVFPRDALAFLPRIDDADFFRFCEIKARWLRAHSKNAFVSARYAAKAAREVLHSHRALYLSRLLEKRDTSDIWSYFTFWSSVFRDLDYGLNQDYVWTDGILPHKVKTSNVPEVWKLYRALSCANYKKKHLDALKEVETIVQGPMGDLIFANSVATYKELPKKLSEKQQEETEFTPVHLFDNGIDLELVRKVLPKILPNGKSAHLWIIPLDFSYCLVDRTPTEREFVHVLKTHCNLPETNSDNHGLSTDVELSVRQIRDHFLKLQQSNVYPALWYLPNSENRIPLDNALNKDDIWKTLLSYVVRRFSDSALAIFESRVSTNNLTDKVRLATRKLERTLGRKFTETEIRKMLKSLNFSHHLSVVGEESPTEELSVDEIISNLGIQDVYIGGGKVLV